MEYSAEIQERFKAMLIQSYLNNMESSSSETSAEDLAKFIGYLYEHKLVSEAVSKRYVVLYEIYRLKAAGKRITPIIEQLAIDLDISEKHLWNIWKDYGGK